jgi:hypothetical protein
MFNLGIKRRLSDETPAVTRRPARHYTAKQPRCLRATMAEQHEIYDHVRHEDVDRISGHADQMGILV